MSTIFGPKDVYSCTNVKMPFLKKLTKWCFVNKTAATCMGRMRLTKFTENYEHLLK